METRLGNIAPLIYATGSSRSSSLSMAPSLRIHYYYIGRPDCDCHGAQKHTSKLNTRLDDIRHCSPKVGPCSRRRNPYTKSASALYDAIRRVVHTRLIQHIYWAFIDTHIIGKHRVHGDLITIGGACAPSDGAHQYLKWSKKYFSWVIYRQESDELLLHDIQDKVMYNLELWSSSSHSEIFP